MGFLLNSDDQTPPKKKKPVRPLMPEEKALWRDVTADIKPFYAQDEVKLDAPILPPPQENNQTIDRYSLLPLPSTYMSLSRDMDRRTRDKLVKGKMPLDARLDLHGMTQDQAKSALDGFIRASYAAGRRCLLVITGKGQGTDHSERHWDAGDYAPRGVLRQRVPEWLNGSDYAAIILNISPAQPKDGGAGALYVYLRKNPSRL